MVVSGGKDVEGPANFSLSMTGEGEGTAGIHCFAIFYSTTPTPKIIPKTINPNPMKKTLYYPVRAYTTPPNKGATSTATDILILT